MTHLNALELRLSNERWYLAMAKTNGERELRRVWISQIEKEISHEMKFHADEIEMSDDEILKELMA